MPKKLSAEALDVLGQYMVFVGPNAVIGKALDRKLYVEVNGALEALGGKWNRSKKAHVFAEDPRDAIDQVLVDGAFSDKRRDLDQFFTPTALANLVVDGADVAGKTVLEPSAGHGALALSAIRHGASGVMCIEKDEACCKVLSAAGLNVLHSDFLDWSSPRFTYDRVVMNPPFSRQQDIVHVTRALQFVKPGGRLVAVMAAGARFRQDRRAVEFRELVDANDGDIAELPAQPFRESGTDVNAVVVTINPT